jgi:hypothetical protein
VCVAVFLNGKVPLDRVKKYLRLDLEQDPIHFYSNYKIFCIKKLMVNGLNIFQMIYFFLSLSPRVLAFWLMDDGAKAGNSVYLQTKGFTFADVYKLAVLRTALLHYKLGVICHSTKS